jgi:RNA polymerase sigma factor (sigma-70 family)
MQGDSAIEIFEKNKPKIIIMLNKLQVQLGFYLQPEESINECMTKWIDCFETTYEDDEQFMRYMFVVMKNRIKDLKRLYYRYQAMHVSDPSRISKSQDGEDSGHVRVWNEMAVDTKENQPIENAIINEYVKLITENLSLDLHKKVFDRLVEGKPHKVIAEELGVSSCNVVKIKREIIWPIVKEIMKIGNDRYDVLIDSGRIYSS